MRRGLHSHWWNELRKINTSLEDYLTPMASTDYVNDPTTRFDKVRQSSSGSTHLRIITHSWGTRACKWRLQLCLILSTPILQICFSSRDLSINGLFGTIYCAAGDHKGAVTPTCPMGEVPLATPAAGAAPLLCTISCGSCALELSTIMQLVLAAGVSVACRPH